MERALKGFKIIKKGRGTKTKTTTTLPDVTILFIGLDGSKAAAAAIGPEWPNLQFPVSRMIRILPLMIL